MLFCYFQVKSSNVHTVNDCTDMRPTSERISVNGIRVFECHVPFAAAPSQGTTLCADISPGSTKLNMERRRSTRRLRRTIYKIMPPLREHKHLTQGVLSKEQQLCSCSLSHSHLLKTNKITNTPYIPRKILPLPYTGKASRSESVRYIIINNYIINIYSYNIKQSENCTVVSKSNAKAHTRVSIKDIFKKKK